MCIKHILINYIDWEYLVIIRYPVIIRSSFSPDRYPVDYYPVPGKTVSGTSLHLSDSHGDKNLLDESQFCGSVKGNLTVSLMKCSLSRNLLLV